MGKNGNLKDMRFSPAKRIAWFSLITVISLISFALGILFIRYVLPSHVHYEEALSVPPLLIALTSFMVGGFCLVLGTILYTLVIATRCFTFNFNRPFWNNVKVKLYSTNIFVLFFFDIGVGFLLSAFITPFLMALGLPFIIALAIPILGAVVSVGLLTSFVSIWTPLDRPMITQRLRSLDVPQEDIAKGILVGISDPAKSSFKKFTMVEEDVGMLWLKPERLVYHGDSRSFEILRSELIAIERSSDPGSLAAYGGAVDIILHFMQDGGQERRIRLHTEGNWTLIAVRRSLDSLAQKLTIWNKDYENGRRVERDRA
jgi:hypothetical protein